MHKHNENKGIDTLRKGSFKPIGRLDDCCTLLNQRKKCVCAQSHKSGYIAHNYIKLFNGLVSKCTSAFRCITNRERKCVDTICTVLVHRTGYSQGKNTKWFLKENYQQQFYQTALENCYGLTLPTCTCRMQLYEISLLCNLTYFLTHFRST